MMKNQKKIAVIMAGGRGTRLWPMSRTSRPKQFHALTSERTMIGETFGRLSPIFGAENIYVATNASYVKDVQEALPELPHEHIIAEPCARDTASGTALMCAVIAARHPDAIVATFPADHVITNPQVLQGAMGPAVQYLLTPEHRNYIVTFGIRPRYPETGFGYIKRGKISKNYGAYTIFEVEAFVEKPDFKKAKSYLEDGNYEWNAGMFVFRVAAMIDKFAQHAPETYKKLEKIRSVVDTEGYDEVLEAVFPTMEKVSIDYAILEKDSTISVLPLMLSWSDVGSWSALHEIIATNSNQNIARGELIAHESTGLFVRTTKPVVTIGIKDIIIIDTDDVLLVCDKGQTQKVSAVVKELEAEGRSELL